MPRNKHLIVIGNLLLVVAWGIWCAFFLAKGLDFTDEGMYCADAWRFAQGDLPFRNSFAGLGLPFWWLSWVFHIYPECGLLGLRIVWAMAMLLCALVTANLMLNHFNPTASFVGAAVSLLFVTGGVIKVLSFNSMPVLGLLVAAWLWLTACSRSGKLQALLAGAAGMVAFLATTCRVPLLIIVLLPALTIVYDRCCGVKMDGRLRATIAFLATYLGGLACFFLAVGLTGLMSDLFSSLVATTSMHQHTLETMILSLRYSSLYYLLPALLILIAVFIKRFNDVIVFARKHRRTIMYIVLPILIACIFIVIFDWAATYKVLGWLKGDIHRLFAGPVAYSRPIGLLLALAIGVVLADVIFHIFDSNSNKVASRMHRRCRLGIIAIFLSFLMILGTANEPARSIIYISWLPISMAIGILWLWVLERAKYLIKTSFIWLPRIAFIALLLLYACNGIAANRCPYRERPVNELAAMPTTAKLHGILTTSKRAHIVDQLVDAVKLNSKAGDRILAYENLPMLYYLTDRLPSTNIAWLSEIFPRSLRQSIFEDMVNRDRLPKLVIRATYTTRHHSWPATKRPLYWKGNQQETDPIDKYIREHYKVIQEINGFQVMVPIE